MERGKRPCHLCQRNIALTSSGRFRFHKLGGSRCAGSGKVILQSCFYHVSEAKSNKGTEKMNSPIATLPVRVEDSRHLSCFSITLAQRIAIWHIQFKARVPAVTHFCNNI
ncbi:hypothetical protein GJ496_002511 [Pomphorhynchus laevis]|nr:hypothetical protein GJ496_000812 [Pomphorhynchus laevis]KAI0987865.1 hypothetical protein GJ496_000815 [Pomphorhynchus laevis]KAI0989153.1 hypothetical protein GJ496_002511 [Pomphorhynchus laevis]